MSGQPNPQPGSGVRKFHCPKDRECLDIANENLWTGFNCDACRYIECTGTVRYTWMRTASGGLSAQSVGRGVSKWLGVGR